LAADFRRSDFDMPLELRVFIGRRVRIRNQVLVDFQALVIRWGVSHDLGQLASQV
jgi:hypothetical protein